MSSTAPARLHTRAVLVIILVSYFMILLDNSIIFTALPRIHSAMHYSDTGLAWVQDAYTLVFGGLLLLGARAGDLLGRRRVFIVGLAVFAVASLLVGLSPAGWSLIAARGLQGIGAAIVAPSSLSLLTASFPAGPARARAVALYGATAGIGSSLGLVVGGALADWVSWRAGFFLNVPIGIAMIVLAPRYLPETTTKRGRFDLTGAICATVGVGAIVYGIIHAADASWTSPTTLASLAVGLGLVVALAHFERGAAQPIMPLRLFVSRERVGAYLGRFLYLAAMIGFFYFGTQYLQGVLGFSAFRAGVAFFPMTVVNFAVAMAIPRLTARLGLGIPLATGVAATLIGMWWLAQVGVTSSYWSAVAAPMLFIGAGQGLAFAPMTSAGISGVDADDAGAASGLVNTFHQLGMALGLGVLVTTSANSGSHLTSAAAVLTARVDTALSAGSVLLALCLIVTVALVVVPGVSVRRPGLTSLDRTQPIPTDGPALATAANK
ncbi:MFS transporter [Jatrophihabitans telluris]|uniref:MFS transporter n=1 Tax=Jatrophihabitans telluris TaxID=2038343 RepID=A0ABY4QWM0_9ACTN|nr:MFS transporter [Jatrophihabitans telluris]UQX87748.1 MFS transporter [Jatrophihabitans telluris]